MESSTGPANFGRVVVTNAGVGTGGSTIAISEVSKASFSEPFPAGINTQIVEASTAIIFEQSITDTKTKAWTLPGGQSSKVGFRPLFMCTTVMSQCCDGDSHGEACTGYREAGEAAELMQSL